jgi:hypothetical protein
MSLKGGMFAGLGKKAEKNVKVRWAGNGHVRERRRVRELQARGGG